jgi:hypothetical protein|nr:MAG TPA: homing endonuclease [Crassvirales sp.]
MENWKIIEGTTYRVSNLGRIQNSKGKILSPYKNKFGYLSIDLFVNGKKWKCKVHRLVAITFIPNPNNLPMVNHKDEDKTNNNVTNLEWCDNSYNLSYGSRTEKMFQSRKKRNRKTAQKQVMQLDLQGNIMASYNSISEASRFTGISCGAIWQSCNQGCITNRLYKWKYKQ